MRIQILHSSIRIFGLSWNKWVENCVVEWKFTKLKVFPPLRPFGASAEGNSRHFSSKITSSENPVKHRYRICLSTFFLVYSLDGFLSQIFYFYWAAKAKITTATKCDASSSWSDENRNPSNGLKVIMSNRNVNNPIKISFFLLVLCLCVCFQAYAISKMYLLYSKADKTFTRWKFVYKSYWWYHYKFSLFLSTHFFPRVFVCGDDDGSADANIIFFWPKEEQPID